METNLAKYKNDLAALIQKGAKLLRAMEHECHPNEFREMVERGLKKKRPTSSRSQLKELVEVYISELPSFSDDYQEWYSEAHRLVKQLLPDRLSDFVRLYEKPKGRKSLQYGNYVIEDYMQGLTSRAGGDVRVGPYAAIPQFTQQLNILKSVERRFESSLFDIKHLVQADVFDSELDAAGELLKKKFIRAAGAMAGVVLERHLQQVCERHDISLGKRHPTIGDLNTALKEAGIIDIPQWRFVQHLADIRNYCDHDRRNEPTLENVKDLIEGVKKVSKTLL